MGIRIRRKVDAIIEGSFGINGTMGSLNAQVLIANTESSDPGTVRLTMSSGMRDMGDTRPADISEISIPLEEWDDFVAAVNEVRASKA